MRLGSILVAFLSFLPVAASASIQLAWNACPGTAGAVSTITFDCDPQADAVYELNATFVPRFTLRDVVAMDANFDLLFGNDQSPSSGTPPFWQMSAQGIPNPMCEALVPVAVDTRPAGCTSSQGLLCNPSGSLCDIYLTSYRWGSSINFPPNRARLLLTMIRSENHPPDTLAQESHFAFAVHFYQSLSEPGREFCEGCETPVGITWNHALFYSGDGGYAALMRSSDPGSEPTVGINCAPGTCLAVPNRKSTWGMLKALYR